MQYELYINDVLVIGPEFMETILQELERQGLDADSDGVEIEECSGYN